MTTETKEGFVSIPAVSKYEINPNTKEMRGVKTGKKLSLKDGKTYQFLDDARKYHNLTPEKVLEMVSKSSMKSVAPAKTKKEKTPRDGNKAAQIKELHEKGKTVQQIKEITGITEGHYVNDVVWRINNPSKKKK